MRRPPAPARPHALFALLAAGLTVEHLLSAPAVTAVVALEAALPLALAAVTAVAGCRFRGLDPSREQTLEAGAILLAGGVYGGAFVAFIAWLQGLNGTAFDKLGYTVLMAGAGGVAMAAVIAHFYVAFDARVADLDAQYRRAEHLRKQVSVLDRVLRHNLRNDLVAVRGYVDRLAGAEGDDAAAAREQLLDRLAAIEETGEFARRVQGVLRTEGRETFDLSEVVTGELDALDLPDGIEVRTDLRDAPVTALPQLREAVGEAVANAVEHNAGTDGAGTDRAGADGTGADDGLTVRVGVDRAADGRWRLRVADDGGGVPEEEIEALHSEEEDALTHGQGIGLFFMQTAIEESGGEFELARNEDGGTTVTMTLPPAAAEDAQAPRAAAA